MNPAPTLLQSTPLSRLAEGNTGAEAQAAIEGLSATLGTAAEVVMHEEVDRGGVKGAEGGRMQGLGEQLKPPVNSQRNIARSKLTSSTLRAPKRASRRCAPKHQHLQDHAPEAHRAPTAVLE